MTPTGSDVLFASVAHGRISHQKEIGQRRYASVRIFTGLATWWNDSLTRSSTADVWQPATTSSEPTTLHSSSLRRSGYGYALMSPRPSHLVDVDLDSATPNKSPLENDPMIGDRDLGCPRVNCHESG